MSSSLYKIMKLLAFDFTAHSSIWTAKVPHRSLGVRRMAGGAWVRDHYWIIQVGRDLGRSLGPTLHPNRLKIVKKKRRKATCKFFKLGRYTEKGRWQRWVERQRREVFQSFISFESTQLTGRIQGKEGCNSHYLYMENWDTQVSCGGELTKQQMNCAKFTWWTYPCTSVRCLDAVMGKYLCWKRHDINITTASMSK